MAGGRERGVTAGTPGGHQIGDTMTPDQSTMCPNGGAGGFKTNKIKHEYLEWTGRFSSFSPS